MFNIHSIFPDILVREKNAASFCEKKSTKHVQLTHRIEALDVGSEKAALNPDTWDNGIYDNIIVVPDIMVGFSTTFQTANNGRMVTGIEVQAGSNNTWEANPEQAVVKQYGCCSSNY